MEGVCGCTLQKYQPQPGVVWGHWPRVSVPATLHLYFQCPLLLLSSLFSLSLICTLTFSHLSTPSLQLLCALAKFPGQAVSLRVDPWPSVWPWLTFSQPRRRGHSRASREMPERNSWWVMLLFGSATVARGWFCGDCDWFSSPAAREEDCREWQPPSWHCHWSSGGASKW